MRKFSLFVRNFFASPEMQAALDQEVVTEDKVAPGQLRKKGDWYYLSVLRVVRIKNFNAVLWDLEDKDVNCIRVVLFQIKDNKLLIRGSKLYHKDLASYFEAIALKLATNLKKEIDPTKMKEVCLEFFRIELPIIDLDMTVERLEAAEAVADIKKLRMRKVEIAVGNIQNCIVNTADYGGAKKILGEDESKAFGVEVAMKKPPKTLIYCDLDAQVRCVTKDDDTDVEKLTVGCALRLC